MAEVATAPNGDVAVPLDTIPISPEGDPHDDMNGDENHAAADDGEVITVFHDADNFNVKHPLASAWTLWFTKPPSGKGDNWNDLLKEVISFDSVEEFWGIYNNIMPTSSLPVKADYHLFKHGVRPEWEDQQNKRGGKWAFTSEDRKNIPIDELWLNVVLAAIGETLEEEEDNEVMGVVVNVRKQFYRIGLWTRTTGQAIQDKGRTTEQGKDTLYRIGRNFKKAMGLSEDKPVEFTGHSDSARSGQSRANAKLTV